MIQIIVFALGLILGGVVVWFYKKPEKRKTGSENIGEFNKERERVIDKNKRKILDFMAGKEKITNDDVQKLLGVSDATAERYLNELEKERQIKQVGEVGHYVYYKKA